MINTVAIRTFVLVATVLYLIHQFPAFEVSVGHQRRAAVPRTGDVQHIHILLLDDPVQVHIDEVLAGRRAPVSDHQRLHVR